MRSIRRLAGLVGLCLVLGTSVAWAEAPTSSARREIGVTMRWLAQVQAFLIAIWENEAPAAPGTLAGDDPGHIDPWGRTSPGTGTPTSPGTPTADDPGHIDPLGGSGR